MELYDGSLEGLFVILDKVCRGAPLPDRVVPASATPDSPPVFIRPNPGVSNRRETPVQGDLFGTDGETPPLEGKNRRRQPHFRRENAASLGEGKNPGGSLSYGVRAAPCRGDGAAKELRSASVNAYDHFLYGWMSEFPIVPELIRFAWKVISAARTGGQGRPGGMGSPEARLAADRAATDRGDPAVSPVLAASFKVCREIDRLRGLLRFAPDSGGVYTARCAPDHFVLPGLADHFFRRFGDIPWTIIDEKRSLVLVCPEGEDPRLIPAGTLSCFKTVFAETAGNIAGPHKGAADTSDADPWTEMWRNYHRAINNETRKNPALQRQFMPERYRKYLNEL
jgi:hypothetical protein